MDTSKAMALGTVSEALLALVPVYGAALIGVVTFLSCVALPVPASLAMLAGGAFAATGDLALAGVMTAAFIGALTGDQAGYWLGRRGGGLVAKVAQRPNSAHMFARARSSLRGNAFGVVFLSRWLFSPLGPWVNLAAGAMGVRWGVFSLGSITGEAVWVVVYVGLGWVFAAQVDRVGETMTTLAGVLAGAAVTALLARALWRVRRR
ncbi:MAG: DedA family protein [Gemmobacter sp.]|nr:DedA family protein [Gemmobacter sp.]